VMLPKEGKRSTEDWVCCPETAWVDYFGVPVESASAARDFIKLDADCQLRLVPVCVGLSQ